MRMSAVLVACLVVLLGSMAFRAPVVFAEDATSTSFSATRMIINAFGGDSTSSGFWSVLTGEETATGESSSTNFQMTMGTMYFESFAPKSQNWRWYDDESSVTPATALAAENTAPIDIEADNGIKLRIAVAEMADIGAANVKLRLQYSTTSDFSSGQYFVGEVGECSGSTPWCYVNGAGVDNATITDKVLTDTDACTAGVGAGCGVHNESGTTTSAFTHAASTTVEYEFTLKHSGALSNTTYFFRAYYVGGSAAVPYSTGESYPSLVTGGTTLSFTINGVTAGTATEGQTLSVDSDPELLEFGSLPFDTALTGAHRLTVSTNASGGYVIYVFERQALMEPLGVTIDPITGTNVSPSSWSSGCTVSASGCYGYHVGDDTLSSGSTRFAANDTYAKFQGIPEEVAYSNAPVTNESTDILYRLLVRENQEAGLYTGSVFYIIVPTF